MPCLLRSITTMVDDRELVVRRLTRQPRRTCHKTCYSATLHTMNKVKLPGNREETVCRFYSFPSPKQRTARAKPCPKILMKCFIYLGLYDTLPYVTVTENLSISSHFKGREFHILRDYIYSVLSGLVLHKTWSPCSDPSIVITFS